MKKEEHYRAALKECEEFNEYRSGWIKELSGIVRHSKQTRNTFYERTYRQYYKSNDTNCWRPI